MIYLDFTANGRRPSVGQIIKRWKDKGRPDNFEVTYGETFAVFERQEGRDIWFAHGNGCSGFNRSAVEKELNNQQ